MRPSRLWFHIRFGEWTPWRAIETIRWLNKWTGGWQEPITCSEEASYDDACQQYNQATRVLWTWVLGLLAVATLAAVFTL